MKMKMEKQKTTTNFGKVLASLIGDIPSGRQSVKTDNTNSQKEARKPYRYRRTVCTSSNVPSTTTREKQEEE